MKLVSLGLLMLTFAVVSLAGCSGKSEESSAPPKTQAPPAGGQAPTGAPPTNPGVLPRPSGN